jgi:predicted Zn finger-like uncharacterized protein
MVQVWTAGTRGGFKCPHCGARYAIQINRLPARESGEATCVECQKVMASWSGTTIPSFTLKTHADGSPA